MTNDIQQARDVLAKWRSEATEGTWEHHQDGIVLVNDFIHSGDTTIAEDLFTPEARLIVGTAGNPDLLDAIDAFLGMVASGELRDRQGHAERIAAAIIAADERMSA